MRHYGYELDGGNTKDRFNNWQTTLHSISDHTKLNQSFPGTTPILLLLLLRTTNENVNVPKFKRPSVVIENFRLSVSDDFY